jgi:rhodanese-related sulfurtransferase
MLRILLCCTCAAALQLAPGAPHHLIFVCQAGGRSAAAAEFMASIGGTALMDVAGGMSAWSGPRVTGGQTA